MRNFIQTSDSSIKSGPPNFLNLTLIYRSTRVSNPFIKKKKNYFDKNKNKFHLIKIKINISLNLFTKLSITADAGT